MVIKWLEKLPPAPTKREFLDVLKSHGFRTSINGLGFQPVPPPEFDLHSVFYDHQLNCVIIEAHYSERKFFDPNKLDGYLSIKRVMLL